MKGKASDNYLTDKWLMEIFKDWYDPCPYNEEELDSNGLESEWPDMTYVNPPYSNIAEWVHKAIEENRRGKTIAMLLKMDTSTMWFAKLKQENARFLWINRRLQHQTGKQSNFPSMLVLLSKYKY